MPVIVAAAARYIIIFTIQWVATVLIEKYVLGIINKAIKAIMVTFGVDEETAKDIMANEVIQTAEFVVAGALVMKSKMPIKIAELLGFTTKGFSLRKLTTAVQSKVSNTTSLVQKSAPVSPSSLKEVVELVSLQRGTSTNVISKAFSGLSKWADKAFLYSLAFANIIDFGNWNSGAYQKLAQKVIAVASFGLITPDTPTPKSSVLSDDTWNRVFNTYKEQGAKGINDPKKAMTVLFTRQNMIDLVDNIASMLAIDGVQTSFKNVIEAVTPFIIIPQNAEILSNSSTSGSITSNTSITQAESTAVKVFTGILSSGTIGDGLSFTPRQDDLIENMAELQQAINNNVAPFITSLIGRITYEVKVTSSVIVKGVRRYGTTQIIQTGNTKTGKAVMKTVRNKFAVVDLFLAKEDGGRTKIGSVILGPTNAINFQPGENDLANLSQVVSKNILTSNTDEISTIATNTPTSIVTPSNSNVTGGVSAGTVGQTPAVSAVPAELPPVNIDIGGRSVLVNGNIFNEIVGKIKEGSMTIEQGAKVLTTSNAGLYANIFGAQAALAYSAGIDVPYKRDYNYGSIPTFVEPQRESNNTQNSVSSTSSSTASQNTQSSLPQGALQATTLSTFYNALGQSLPSIESRGQTYQSLGLGQAAFYTGTAEQNTRLLQALKNR